MLFVAVSCVFVKFHGKRGIPYQGAVWKKRKIYIPFIYLTINLFNVNVTDIRVLEGYLLDFNITKHITGHNDCVKHVKGYSGNT